MSERSDITRVQYGYNLLHPHDQLQEKCYDLPPFEDNDLHLIDILCFNDWQ